MLPCASTAPVDCICVVLLVCPSLSVSRSLSLSLSVSLCRCLCVYVRHGHWLSHCFISHSQPFNFMSRITRYCLDAASVTRSASRRPPSQQPPHTRHHANFPRSSPVPSTVRPAPNNVCGISYVFRGHPLCYSLRHINSTNNSGGCRGMVVVGFGRTQPLASRDCLQLPAIMNAKFTYSVLLLSAFFRITSFMVALCNRETIYIFMLWFVLLLFFPRLISAAADWMSTILRHMVWS